jgi:hypothetical protein
VGPQLTAMGHKASSGSGGLAGGYQGIMMVPDPEGGPALSTCRSHHDRDRDDTDCGVNGFYRAGSNFREDGTSIGW